jgi:tRNA pseudouridine55 synthase
VNGLLLVDKPSGMTSHDVVRRVRRIFQTRKVGHAGTLDPLATGVLPIAVGSGTKVLQFLLVEEKSYRVTCRLGITTDSLDADGQVVRERPVPQLEQTVIEAVCRDFIGDIEQVPPMHSAIKQNGRPLYKLAHQGKTVVRQARPVRIDRLEIVAWEAPLLTLEIACGKGTYVRSLVADIGERLGCGAHVTGLSRLSCGDFSLNECYQLEQLETLEQPASALLDLLTALRRYPVVDLDLAAARSLRYGIPPQREQVVGDTDLADGQRVRLRDNGQLAAVARYQAAAKQQQKGDFELLRVFVSH